MRFISWNVNGLRACRQKGFDNFFFSIGADFFCVQETKLQEHQIEFDTPGYEQFWFSAEKKGYSGTAIFAKRAPLSVRKGLGKPEFDCEGRCITLEYDDFYLVTCYVPNAQDELKRIDYRLDWELAFRTYLTELDAIKPVIMCGDLNVAHKEIDLKNPQANRGRPGFSDEERAEMGKMLGSGFTDSFRFLYPELENAYSWWSYRAASRERNVGWRIDYFLVSDRLRDNISKAYICSEIMGSDHCPVGLDIVW